MLRVAAGPADGTGSLTLPGETGYGTRTMNVERSEAQRSFADWVTLRLPDLLRFAHALTGNPHDASDLVQEVLERVGVKWSSIGHGGAPDAYVRRALVNARTSRWRRRRPETLVDVIPE